MKLVVATRNQHKLEEIRAILAGLPYEVVSLADFPPIPDVPEDASSFEENALIKAHQVVAHTNHLTLADDSGLVVDALDGAPGVHSKRFGGPTDADRNAKLLRLLRDVPEEKRTARFVCAAALVWPDGREVTVRGTCEGRIAWEPRGEEGFGYDPLFVPTALSGERPPPEGEPDGQRTFAELGRAIKNRISHRARAFQQVRRILEESLPIERRTSD